MNDRVTCTTCGMESNAGQRFCGNCGSALPVICTNCGSANPAGQHFCGTCGTALPASAPLPAGAPFVAGPQAPVAVPTSAPGAAPTTTPAPGAAPTTTPAPTAGVGAGASPAGGTSPVAERRLVSVLFADLVGFTPFAEERDSEEVRDTLTRYFGIATDVITRYGGIIEKFIGDAVMAVWGTPTALEDDAERAVRAAMELVDAVRALGSGIQARGGVLTGEAAVTIGATNQGMVAGDLVNTAARLQSVAAPSTVLVGEATFRAASKAIAFEPAGDQTLKGKAAPVPAWRALRVVAHRGGRNRGDALEAPFVGRDVELRLLKELFHATSAERRMRHVSVVGMGGVGKTRLAWELEKYLDGIDEGIWWHQGRSPAYGQGVTFWSLGEMIRSRAGLVESDDQPTTRARISAMLDEHMPAHPDRAWVESALLELLGIPSGLPADELFGAWRTFFDSLAATGTVALVFQDLQWADSGTLDFIDHLVEWSRAQPIFVLTLARPELLEQRPDWAAARRSFTSVFLEPLPESAMRELLAGLVRGVPERTISAIVSRAEGVPLYAVETVRMLIGDGHLVPAADSPDVYVAARDMGDLAELAVPETLTGLIAARLDGLDPLDRSLLLDAAVLGQSFTPTALVAISGRDAAEVEARLRMLLRRELLTHVVDPRSPERGQYQFVQALIREVAYNTLAKKDRKARHLAAARWFESVGDQELVGALAGHYLSARTYAAEGAEADALATQARIALKAAGDRASSLGASRQAVAFYEQALSVAADPAETADLHERAGINATTAAEVDQADEHFLAALAIHLDRGDRSASARLIGLRGLVLVNGRRVERAIALLEQAVTEYADLGDDPARLRLLSQLARAQFLGGAADRAIEVADDVLAAAERADELLILADTLVTKGSAMTGGGRRREGVGVIDVGGRIAEENGFTDVQLRALNNRLTTIGEEQPRTGWESASAGLVLARRVGDRQWVHNFSGSLGYMALRVGEWAAGESLLEAALADTTDPLDRVLPLNNLVNLRALLGKPYAAEFAELEAIAQSTGELATVQLYVPESRGWIAFGAGRLQEARAIWRDMAGSDLVGSSPALEWTARISIWLNDPEGAATDLANFWARLAHGGAIEASHDIVVAGLAGLRGERADALAAYRAVAPRLIELRLPFDDALLAIDMIYALGPAEPFVAEAVSRARATLTRLKAVAVLDLLQAALDHGPHAPADAGKSDSGAPVRASRTRRSGTATATEPGA